MPSLLRPTPSPQSGRRRSKKQHLVLDLQQRILAPACRSRQLFRSLFHTSGGGDLSYYCACYCQVTTLEKGWLVTRPFSVDVWKCNIAPGTFFCLPPGSSLPIPAGPFSSSKALSNAGRTGTSAGKFPISVWFASMKNRTPAQAPTPARLPGSLPRAPKLQTRMLNRSPAVRLWLPRLQLAAPVPAPATGAPKPPEISRGLSRTLPPASSKTKFSYNDPFLVANCSRPEANRRLGGLS